ncbi:MAG: glycosyltransferase involved in cell wall biosynthesis [Lentimonas sp.]|jgi:glycosyltransferase involved in cell wall biosynthesis
MPKVLRIINRFNLGGPTYNVAYLTRYLNHGFETKLIGGVSDKGEADSMHILNSQGLYPETIENLKRNPNIKDDIAAYRCIKQIIQEYKPDIVHTHASKAGALGRLAAANLKVPIVVHTYHGNVFQGYFGKISSTIFKIIERWLARKTDGIVAISPQQENELSEKHQICKKEKIRVIPLGFDLSRFSENKEEKRILTREKYNLKDDDLAIAIIGRLAPVKNHVFFIDTVFKAAKITQKSLKVFVVGDGEERGNIEEIISKKTLPKNLEFVFTSWVKEMDVFNAGMDIICLTSKNEGTPVSLIEAQASGVAVLSTDVGGVRDVVDHDKTGIIVPPNRIDLFVEKLLVLIEDKQKRDFMSQNGWNYVKDKFHYQKLVDNMERFYLELLEKKYETKT